MSDLQADLLAAMEKLRDAPVRHCEHVVHPEATGLTRCADCGQMVEATR